MAEKSLSPEDTVWEAAWEAAWEAGDSKVCERVQWRRSLYHHKILFWKKEQQ